MKQMAVGTALRLRAISTVLTLLLAALVPVGSLSAQSVSVELRVVDAVVPETDAEGGPWRSLLGPVPEIRPYVLVSLNDRPVLRTHAIPGSYTPRWNLGVTLPEVWNGDIIEFRLILASREWPELAVAWSIAGVTVGTTLGQLSRWLESDIVVAQFSWTPNPEFLSCEWEEIRMPLRDRHDRDQGYVAGMVRRDCHGDRRSEYVPPPRSPITAPSLQRPD